MKNWSKVVITVHMPYINSNHLREKTRERKEKKKKKKKKKENAETQRSKRQRLSKHYHNSLSLFSFDLV